MRWYHITEEKDKKIINRLEYSHSIESIALPMKKPLSERVFEGMMYEEQYGNRQGQRTDLSLRENSHEVMGRTDKNIAEKFAVGSEWTYRLAKKVMEKGTFELIKAMDAGLPVYLAATVAEQSHELQRRILNLSRKEIIAYVKEKTMDINKSSFKVT